MSLSSPEWYAAVSLTERVARLRKQNLSTPPSEQALQKAQRYLARWRAQTPFNQSDYFAQRLALLEVREDELLDLLSQPLDTLQHHFEAPPRWLQQLDDAFQRYDSADWAAQARQNQDDRLGGLLAITSPLVQAGTARLRAGVRALAAEHDTVPFDPRSIDRILMAPIANGLMTMVSRILVFEMQLTALNRPLQGDTPEARFDDFVQRLGDKTYALELLRLYPVLAQRLVTYVDNWVSVRLEFLRRLCADQAALRAAFAPQRADIGRLVALKGDLGDRHRGGRSVMIARFDSGLQVVYKPKPMQVDVAFQSLLGWFNARQGERPFRQARLVARDTYGWIEFFETAPCQSEAEVARFYWRMGAYLAILYSLDAADFHAENIIAVGEQPMLIDLETLFHVYFGDYPVENAAQAAEARLRTAVLKIGMLPQKIWGNKDGVAVDVSGLGAPRRQPAPRKTLVWDRPGTDEMRAKFEFVDFEMQSQHRPVLNGREVELGQYADAIYAGFEATYRLIAGQRAAYAALVAQLFADVEVRILARPTQLYTMLLMQANHPDLQRDSLPLNQLFDKLWLDVRHNPKLKQLIPSEMRDLERGDVPLFTTRPHSRHAWDSQGRQIDDCFELSGL
ncbi:MAG: type 2 lantipeptide synthetase LanM family protein, partial [Anaerolineales bacterium]|nr:type 2 lantipeptide synthetase LanM family protein [Anaerolineales bacterium]